MSFCQVMGGMYKKKNTASRCISGGGMCLWPLGEAGVTKQRFWEYESKVNNGKPLSVSPQQACGGLGQGPHTQTTQYRPSFMQVITPSCHSALLLCQGDLSSLREKHRKKQVVLISTKYPKESKDYFWSADMESVTTRGHHWT